MTLGRPGLAPGRFFICARDSLEGEIMSRLDRRRAVYTFLAAILATCALSGIASAGVLDRLTQDKTIRIAYREDAPPFSAKDKLGEPIGFMVDLCREVAKKLADQLHLPSLNVAYVSVTAADRFEAIRQQK